MDNDTKVPETKQVSKLDVESISIIKEKIKQARDSFAKLSAQKQELQGKLDAVTTELLQIQGGVRGFISLLPKEEADKVIAEIESAKNK